MWGPSGWILLYQTSLDYRPSKKKEIQEFFRLTRNMLPCIYCRRSYRGYIRKYTERHPDWANSKPKMFKTVYDIRNLVNDKLRKQGHVKYADEPHMKMKKMYSKMKPNDAIKGMWGFLYSAAFNYPVNPSQYKKRMYRRYFTLLKDTLPYAKFRKAYSDAWNIMETSHPIRVALKSRFGVIYWLYRMNREVNRILFGQKLCPFKRICQKYERWRARCAKMTCRQVEKDHAIQKDIKGLCAYQKSVE